ncbi:GPI transamidase component PIG-T [Coccinella septempunctata]|uniref:GPI transamidase component PIG-T n=1 Tax=Coccinella septempunctata TaxID=41139 RepID=UPI001D08883B|nr:GPI transamidase component PIG-T [Coccinella septempunctata]
MSHIPYRIIWFCLIVGAMAEDDSFVEELLIKPLNTDHVYNHFHFTTKWSVPDTGFSSHSRIFPRILGELVERYNVQELNIGLTNGLWRYEKWGYPVVNGAPGGEVWAWFKPNTIDIDKNWKELTASLSGLLCASFNFIDRTNTISPEYSLRPRGIVDQYYQVNSSYLRYSSLPREIVCTENLTPWKKLLPCNAKTGLGSLLNSGFIHNTRYHSLGLYLRRICSDEYCSSTSLELQQTISLVYDSKTLGTKNWSLIKFFGQGIINTCSLADSSTIYIDITSNSSNPFHLTEEPDEIITSIRGGTVSKLAKYQFKGKAFSVGANYFPKQEITVTVPPVLCAHQYLSGYGKESGGLVIKLNNNHWSDLDVVLLQNIPWYLQLYLHTLKISSGGRDLKPIMLKFKPGKLRTRYHQLELLLRLPAKSVAMITIDFDFTFLKWQEYPPDANHGFYVGSAIISCHMPLARDFTGLPQDGSMIRDSFNASRNGYLVQIRTETLIVTLPTPDFSMPYNVICLACTVVALAFGPLHNITTKRFILKVKDNSNFISLLKNKLKFTPNKQEKE